MSVFELNLLHAPAETMLFILFVIGFVFYVLGRSFMFVAKFCMILFGGYKAGKGIVEELRKRNK